jgi:hypothetical protein
MLLEGRRYSGTGAAGAGRAVVRGRGSVMAAGFDAVLLFSVALKSAGDGDAAGATAAGDSVAAGSSAGGAAGAGSSAVLLLLLLLLLGSSAGGTDSAGNCTCGSSAAAVEFTLIFLMACVELILILTGLFGCGLDRTATPSDGGCAGKPNLGRTLLLLLLLTDLLASSNNCCSNGISGCCGMTRCPRLPTALPGVSADVRFNRCCCCCCRLGSALRGLGPFPAFTPPLLLLLLLLPLPPALLGPFGWPAVAVLSFGWPAVAVLPFGWPTVAVLSLMLSR